MTTVQISKQQKRLGEFIADASTEDSEFCKQLNELVQCGDDAGKKFDNLNKMYNRFIKSPEAKIDEDH